MAAGPHHPPGPGAGQPELVRRHFGRDPGAAAAPPTMHVYVEQGWLAATELLPEEVGEDEDWYRFRGNEIYIAGTVPAYFSFKNSQLAQGNFFVEADLLGASRALVITHRLAEELFGDGDPIGQIVPLDLHSEEAVDFTVIGVLAPPDDSDPYMALNDGRTAWMPVTVHPSYRGGPDDTTHFYQIHVGVDPGVDLASAGEVVQSEAALLWGKRPLPCAVRWTIGGSPSSRCSAMPCSSGCSPPWAW